MAAYIDNMTAISYKNSNNIIHNKSVKERNNIFTFYKLAIKMLIMDHFYSTHSPTF